MKVFHLIDDDPLDIELIKHAISEAFPDSMVFLPDNIRDIPNFISRRGKYNAVLKADCIIIDVNMPGHHGLDVLDMIPRWKRPRCIMMTSFKFSKDAEINDDRLIALLNKGELTPGRLKELVL